MNSTNPTGTRQVLAERSSRSDPGFATLGLVRRRQWPPRAFLFLAGLLFSRALTPALAQCTRGCGQTPGVTPPANPPTPTPVVVSCSSETALCLSQGHFLITANWTKPDGESGTAHAVNLTADSGYFWFSDPA